MTGKTKHTVSGIVSLQLAVSLWAPAHSITKTKPDRVDWRATTTKGSDQVKKVENHLQVMGWQWGRWALTDCLHSDTGELSGVRSHQCPFTDHMTASVLTAGQEYWWMTSAVRDKLWWSPAFDPSLVQWSCIVHSPKDRQILLAFSGNDTHNTILHMAGNCPTRLVVPIGTSSSPSLCVTYCVHSLI